MDQVAIVTGHGSGFGHDVAAELLRRGYAVVGVSRSTRADDLAAEHGDRLVEVAGSVDDPATVERAFGTAAGLGLLSIVVSNAGGGTYGWPGSFSAQEITDCVGVNLTGLMLFSDAAARHLDPEGGDIVNVMSLASKYAYSQHSLYIAAKAGAKAYTRALRADLVEQGSPHRVFEVYPCGMRTNIFSRSRGALTDGLAFYRPEPFARHLVEQLVPRRPVYAQELTYGFDRSRPADDSLV